MASLVLRTPLQDWTKFLDYLPESLWFQLMSEGQSSYEKADALFKFLLKLGLRCPSEPTWQSVAALHLIVSHGFEQAKDLTSAVKFETFRSTKKLFKGMADKAETLHEIVSVLPDDPQVFRERFRRAWETT